MRKIRIILGIAFTIAFVAAWMIFTAEHQSRIADAWAVAISRGEIQK